MLRSVAEVSVLTGLSKVSIYNKIKLKEIEKYVVKNKGITYISDEGINLIFKGLNFKDDTLNGFALIIGGAMIPFFALKYLGEGSMAKGVEIVTTTHN